MVAAAITITVEPDSEIARLIDEAGDRPLVLIKNGRRYRLEQDDTAKRDPWADYDPEKALAGIRAAAGSWSDIDTDKMIADIYRWREEGSRPPDRP